MSTIAEKPASVNEAQPMSIPNESTPIWDLVLADIHDRDILGRDRYGTPLQTFNGRNPLVDVYQEALDKIVYLRQAIEERAVMAAEIEAWRELGAALIAGAQGAHDGDRDASRATARSVVDRMRAMLPPT